MQYPRRPYSGGSDPDSSNSDCASTQDGRISGDAADVDRICVMTVHELARTHVSYYKDDAKRTKGMCRYQVKVKICLPK